MPIGVPSPVRGMSKETIEKFTRKRNDLNKRRKMQMEVRIARFVKLVDELGGYDGPGNRKLLAQKLGVTERTINNYVHILTESRRCKCCGQVKPPDVDIALVDGEEPEEKPKPKRRSRRTRHTKI